MTGGFFATSDTMPRSLKIEIKESTHQLEKQVKMARTAGQKERLQMLWWLKTRQVTQHQQLAERLGRDPSTVTRWLQRYRQGGLTSLLEVKVGSSRDSCKKVPLTLADINLGGFE